MWLGGVILTGACTCLLIGCLALLSTLCCTDTSLLPCKQAMIATEAVMHDAKWGAPYQNARPSGAVGTGTNSNLERATQRRTLPPIHRWIIGAISYNGLADTTECRRHVSPMVKRNITCLLGACLLSMTGRIAPIDDYTISAACQ